MIERRKTGTLAAAVAIAVALSGCGNLTAGGFGEAVVVVSADVPSTIPAGQSMTAPSFANVGASATRHSDHDHPEGELEVDFLVYLVSATGALVPLSDEAVEVRVDLEGVEQDETLPQVVPADDYTQLRMVFEKIEAEIDAGLIINGQEFMGPVEVDFEGSLEVLKPITLSVSDAERAEILIGLNAASWLQAVDPATGTVDPSIFVNLIEITTR